MKAKKYRYYIGIDSGTKTGYALWDSKEKRFLMIESMKIHVAMENIRMLEREYLDQLFIRVEDARKRTWYGERSNEKLQGAGSVKRDATIWEDFLTDIGANFEMVAPRKGLTKMNSKNFNRMTKWEFPTNEHGRDGAMLVFGM